MILELGSQVDFFCSVCRNDVSGPGLSVLETFAQIGQQFREQRNNAFVGLRSPNGDPVPFPINIVPGQCKMVLKPSGVFIRSRSKASTGSISVTFDPRRPLDGIVPGRAGLGE
jgi:hypothetical protein